MKKPGQITALFNVAKHYAKCENALSVIFIDECDALFDKIGVTRIAELKTVWQTEETDLILIAATNNPWKIEEAVLGRFMSQLFVDLPQKEARRKIIQDTLETRRMELSEDEWEQVLDRTENYSGRELSNLCIEAWDIPVWEKDNGIPQNRQPSDFRPINIGDFQNACKKIKRKAITQRADLIAWRDKGGILAHLSLHISPHSPILAYPTHHSPP